VKVNKNWRSSDKQLKRFGYNQKWYNRFKTLDLYPFKIYYEFYCCYCRQA
jgi:hypothetical protein